MDAIIRRRLSARGNVYSQEEIRESDSSTRIRNEKCVADQEWAEKEKRQRMPIYSRKARQGKKTMDTQHQALGNERYLVLDR